MIAEILDVGVGTTATVGAIMVLELRDSASHLRDEGSFSSTPSPAKLTVTIE